MERIVREVPFTEKEYLDMQGAYIRCVENETKMRIVDMMHQRIGDNVGVILGRVMGFVMGKVEAWSLRETLREEYRTNFTTSSKHPS